MYKYGLLDADILVYQIGFISQTEFDNELYANYQEAIGLIDDFIEQLYSKLSLQNLFVVLGANKGNFRKQLFPEYKANRKDSVRPLLYSVIREYFMRNFKLLSYPNIEGDDVLGLFQSKYSIIITIDKDLDQIPGWHYNWKHDLLYEQSKESSVYMLYYQTLVGDRVDGYFGVPGIGKMRAHRILRGADTEEEMWKRVIETYKSKELTINDAITNARMAYILHRGDYNFKTGEVVLWQPPEIKESEDI